MNNIHPTGGYQPEEHVNIKEVEMPTTKDTMEPTHNAGPSGRIQLQPHERALVHLDLWCNICNVLRALRDDELTLDEAKDLAGQLLDTAGDAVPVLETLKAFDSFDPNNDCLAELPTRLNVGPHGCDKAFDEITSEAVR